MLHVESILTDGLGGFTWCLYLACWRGGHDDDCVVHLAVDDQGTIGGAENRRRHQEQATQDHDVWDIAEWASRMTLCM